MSMTRVLFAVIAGVLAVGGKASSALSTDSGIPRMVLRSDNEMSVVFGSWSVRAAGLLITRFSAADFLDSDADEVTDGTESFPLIADQLQEDND